jgi:hypothetical protein
MENLKSFINHPIVRNISAVVFGVFIGGQLNMFIINHGHNVFPDPPGMDRTNMETLTASLIKNIHLFEPKHFITPFLAHALGTFVSVFIACKIAVSNHLRISMIIGCLSLFGGIMAVKMIPAPLWYNILDLVCAYIPMTWIGLKLSSLSNKKQVQ